jgi:hypothetical protein
LSITTPCPLVPVVNTFVAAAPSAGYPLAIGEALRVEAEIDVAKNKRCSVEWENLYIEIYGRLLCFIHTV